MVTYIDQDATPREVFKALLDDYVTIAKAVVEQKAADPLERTTMLARVNEVRDLFITQYDESVRKHT